MGRHLWLAAWFLAACVLGNDCALAEPANVGEPGDYVLFLDKENKPVAGTYWISRDVRATSKASMQGAIPNNVVYVDREFFPTRMGSPIYFLNIRLSHSGDPTKLDVGQSVDMIEYRRPVGRLAGQIKPWDIPFKLTVRAKVASTVKGYNLTSLVYTKETDVKDPPGDWGRRVYVEPFGIDMPAELAARVATLDVGKAESASDFYAIMVEMADVIPEYTKCIREKRRTEEYKKAVLEDREKMDRPTADDFLSKDIPWWEGENSFGGRMIETLVLDICPLPK